MELIEKIQAMLGKEPVHIYDPFEDLMIRNVPEERGWFVKRRGNEEFKAGPGSMLVTEALNQVTEETLVTAEQYAAFT